MPVKTALVTVLHVIQAQLVLLAILDFSGTELNVLVALQVFLIVQLVTLQEQPVLHAMLLTYFTMETVIIQIVQPNSGTMQEYVKIA